MRLAAVLAGLVLAILVTTVAVAFLQLQARERNVSQLRTMQPKCIGDARAEGVRF